MPLFEATWAFPAHYLIKHEALKAYLVTIERVRFQYLPQLGNYGHKQLSSEHNRFPNYCVVRSMSFLLQFLQGISQIISEVLILVELFNCVKFVLRVCAKVMLWFLIMFYIFYGWEMKCI